MTPVERHARRTTVTISVALIALSQLLLTNVSLGFLLNRAIADTTTPVPVPAPVYVPRQMPLDPPRVNNIGGAKVSSSTPQGETNGVGQPLAAARELSSFTIPVFAKDGIFFPTTWAGKNISIHLPKEMTLQAAAWSGDGGATYSSDSVDYQVAPYSGGGGDIIIRRKTIFSPSDIAVGVKLPEGTHLRNGSNVVLVETDPHPGAPARTIGTFSIPVARDSNRASINVTPGIGPGSPGQTNILINLGGANILAFPIEITLSYRASNTPTSGAFTSDWAGMPDNTNTPQLLPKPIDYVTDPEARYRPPGVDPALYAQRHSGGCQGGPNQYRSDDGRIADFIVACQRQQMCLDAGAANASVDVCNNTLFSNMSTSCVSTFGQIGDEYETCIHVASEEVTWVKANMLTAPLCQPQTPQADTAFLPSNGNRYCAS
ncbi:hypothetical protein A3N95_22155 [Mycobacteroides abscessus]|nr:hypothetical protein [Mycobacteroides abscessus]AMU23230.1 hypothetical protein A3N95_22155 [Mycobacteroides abscessus]